MRQTPKPIGPVALFAALIISGVGIIVPVKTAHADDCLAAPNSPAPQGDHWYFRIDWATKRKCWYHRALGQSEQQVVAQATSMASDRSQSIIPKSASKANPSASASTSTSPAGSAPPLPYLELLAVELHPAPMIGLRTDEDVERRGQEGSSLASAVPQALAVRNATTQADLFNPAAIVALDTTPDADVERSRREGSGASSIPQMPASQETTMIKATAPAEDTGMVPMGPGANGQASDNVESSAKRLFQICVSFLSSQLDALIALDHKWKSVGVLVLLILTFGLPVAGILRAVAMKIVPRRRERVIIDRPAPNLIDNQDQRERRDGQHRQASERYQQEADLTDTFQKEKTFGLSEPPLPRGSPFLRSYTLPDLPNQQTSTYFCFEEGPDKVGRRFADA
jgi:hypothetical protein